MDAEQRTTSLQVVIESPLRGIDAGLRAGLAGVSDVDKSGSPGSARACSTASLIVTS